MASMIALAVNLTPVIHRICALGVQYPLCDTSATETRGQETLFIQGHSCGEVAFIPHLRFLLGIERDTITGSQTTWLSIANVFTAQQSSPEKLVPYFRYHSCSIKCQMLVFHTCSNRFPYPYDHPKMVV